MKIAKHVRQADTVSLLALADTSPTWRELISGDAAPLELKLVAATSTAVLDVGDIKIGKKKLSYVLRKAVKAALDVYPIRRIEKQWLKYLAPAEQKRIIDRTLSDCKSGTHGFLNDMGELGEQMQLLSAKQRERFFRTVEDVCREQYRSEVLPGVLKRMAHFTDAERHRLVVLTVEMALKVRSPWRPEIWLLSKLAEQFEHLSKASRHYLLKRINSIYDETDKADAVSYLAPAAPHLSEAECDQALNVLMRLDDGLRPIRVARFAGRMPRPTVAQCERILEIMSAPTVGDAILADALNHLGPVLARFSSDQHRRLFRLADGLPDPLHRTRAMAGLGGGGIASFNDTERAMILDAIANNRDDDAKAKAIIKVAPETENLTEDEKTRLIEIAIDFNDRVGRSRALGAMLKESAHLSGDQHHSIVRAIRGCGAHMWLALADAVPGMEHLSDELRWLIVGAIGDLDEWTQTEVLEKLGPAMPLLRADQQRALVALAFAIKNKKLKAQALAGLESGLA